jgi:methionyl-tRNA formyltransferase
MATALINGDKKTGMTIIKMDDQIDHGPIIAQESLTIKNNDKRPDLEKKLTDLGFQLFVQSINRLDSIKFQNQNHLKATYTKKLKKEDGFIDFKNFKLKIKNSPEEVFNLFRGLFPWPGLWTVLPNGKRLKITKLTMKQSNNLTIESVQLEGKNEVDFKTFEKAYEYFK